MLRYIVLLLRLVTFPALVATITACRGVNIFGPDTVAERALIIYAGDTSELTIPDIVTRGVPFEVSIRTFGGGCTRRTGRTNVVEQGNEVVILPYNKRSVGGSVCTADIKYLTHAVQLTHDTPGDLVLRIIGDRKDGSTNFEAVSVELTVSVTVR